MKRTLIIATVVLWVVACFGLGACAAEGIEAKRVGKESNSALLLRTVAVATAGKTGLKWDFSPPVAADALLPRRLLGLNRYLTLAAAPSSLSLRALIGARPHRTGGRSTGGPAAVQPRLPRPQLHLGSSCPSRRTAQDTVDTLCAKRNITRHESQLILHRPMRFGFFEHVVGEHRFIDGNFFYRFTDNLP